MQTTLIGVFSLICTILGAGIALAMIILVLWQSSQQVHNRLLALYMLTVVVWGVCVLMYRVTESKAIFAVAAYCFLTNVYLLLLMSAYYAGFTRIRWIHHTLLAGVGFYLVVLPALLATNNMFVNVMLTYGGRMFVLTTPGKVIGWITLAMTIIAVLMLWKPRDKRGRGLLSGAILAPLGVATMLLPIALPLPILIASLTSALMSRIILRDNLFNPLLEVTRVLTTSEAHYRLLSEELSRKEALYHTLARNLPKTTVILFDDKARCLVFEGQPVSIEGQMLDKSVEGRTLAQVLPLELQSSILNLHEGAFAGREARIQSVFDGRDFQIHVVPVSDERGISFAGMFVLQDITDITAAERQTMALALEKERVQILRKFISDATHDLMTPLSGIQLSIDLLRREPSVEDIPRRVERLDVYTKRLIGMVNDMFQVTRLDETGALELRAADVNQLVASVVDVQMPLAREQEHAVSFEPGAVAPASVDEVEFTAALTNLLKNAIAYTPKGGKISVATKQCDREVLIEVSDNGIGISQADIAHVFERFYRADQSRGERGGAGLGLAITRRIIELHGGRIEVESRLSEGSTFRVFLPRSIVQEQVFG